MAALPAVSSAVAEAGCSFSAENFTVALCIAELTLTLTPQETVAFRLFIAQCSAAAAVNLEVAAELGEAPDEFRDPILDTIMLDPVRLPSGHVLDRATVMSHLLSNDTDPFTRQPLSITDVLPDRLLRDRITAWKLARRPSS